MRGSLVKLVPLILCLAVRNTADWEHGMEQDLGRYSFFSASLYTANQTAGTAFMLPPFFFQEKENSDSGEFYILREVRVLRFFRTKRMYFWSGVTHIMQPC